MTQIEKLRTNFGRIVLVFLWSNAVLAGVLAWLGSGENAFAVLATGIVLAAVPTYFLLSRDNDALGRVLSGIAAAGLVSLCVFGLSGQTYQLDMHMYFFAALAFMAGWCDPRALIAFSAVVAVHHLGLNFLYPAAVYPGGGDLIRVSLHAVVLVLQTATLIWITMRLNQALQTSQQAMAAADSAVEQSEVLRSAQDGMIETSAQKQAQVKLMIDQFRSDIVARLESAMQDNEALNKTALALSTATDNTSRRVEETSQITAQMSRNVQSVAGAADQLSTSIAQISGQVGQTTLVVRNATEATRLTNEKIAGLAVAAQKIGEVVSLIQDIAEQTNMLALNATIEAARAGEMGRGFAVVASEVKSLANQTATATEEIGSHINGIQSSTDEAVTAIRAIAETMEEVNTYTAAIAKAVEEQGIAAEAINRNVHLASSGTQDVSANMTGVGDAAVDSTKSVAIVRQSADRFSATTLDLRDTIDSFLENVAAA